MLLRVFTKDKAYSKALFASHACDALQSWQSGANFPTGYVTRPDMNILLGLCPAASTACTASVGSKNLGGATDGDTALSTSAVLAVGPAGRAWLRLQLPGGGPLSLRRVSLRPLVAASALLRVELVTGAGDTILAGALNSTASYSWAQLLGPWQVWKGQLPSARPPKRAHS
jgi:hypothetical protein